MNKNISIKTNDNFIIEWTLDFTSTKSDKLIIFVHWLYADKDEEFYIDSSNYFTIRWFNVFRFNLYWEWNNVRRLNDVDLSVNSNDLNSVIDFLKPNYNDIYLVWHSLWASAILNIDTSIISKIVLWDPSAWLSKEEKNEDMTYNKDKKDYIVHRGEDFSISKAMVEDWEEIYKTKNFCKKINEKMFLVFASKSTIYNNWKSCLSDFNNYVLINNADHNFSWKLIKEELLNYTYKNLIN